MVIIILQGKKKLSADGQSMGGKSPPLAMPLVDNAELRLACQLREAKVI